jgi:hypothetical protein
MVVDTSKNQPSRSGSHRRDRLSGVRLLRHARGCTTAAKPREPRKSSRTPRMLPVVCAIVVIITYGMLAILGDRLAVLYQVVLVLIAFGAVGLAFVRHQKH